jgi:hypothetical protein
MRLGVEALRPALLTGCEWLLPVSHQCLSKSCCRHIATREGLGTDPKRRGAIHPKPPLNCLVRVSC